MADASCSGSANPLSQFQKHVGDDRSLQRDRLTGGNSAAAGFRTGPQAMQDGQVNGFLNGEMDMAGPGMGPMMGLPQMAPPQMGAPMGMMQNPALRPANLVPAMPPAASATIPAAQTPGQMFSTDEFLEMSRSNAQAPMPQPQLMNRNMMMPRSTFQPMYGPQMGMFPASSMAQNMPQMHHDQSQDMAKGKGVAVDAERWEEVFNAIDLADKAAEADQATTQEPELSQTDKGHDAVDETNMGDFESIWKGIQQEKSDELLEEWNNMDFQGDWSRFQAADPASQPYLYEEDNLFAGRPDAFEEGVKIMRQGGNLSLAALAFEAAVQADPSHTQAWVNLGNVQAQNEKDTAAIRALERALQNDPNNLAALMGLAVSYMNEAYDTTAYRTLERWLSVKYPQITPPSKLSAPADIGFTDRKQLHTSIVKQFLGAARLSPDGEHMDPDVQVGLGILFYGSDEFDKAIDCFNSALSSVEIGSSSLKEEQVHLLWNRLGATLANSGRPEDAIGAYMNALQIQPNFVRARYNLGVSCINMGCLEEAAQHFLQALDLHKAIDKEARARAREILGDDDERLDRLTQNRSSSLLDTLRKTFVQMGRPDLAGRVVPGVDPDVFSKDIPWKK